VIKLRKLQQIQYCRPSGFGVLVALAVPAACPGR